MNKSDANIYLGLMILFFIITLIGTSLSIPTLAYIGVIGAVGFGLSIPVLNFIFSK